MRRKSKSCRVVLATSSFKEQVMPPMLLCLAVPYRFRVKVRRSYEYLSIHMRHIPCYAS